MNNDGKIEWMFWDNLTADGWPKSKSQTNRMIREKSFPEPSGYIGKTPFWTRQQWEKLKADCLGRKFRENAAA
jgi:hypothetical protein